LEKIPFATSALWTDLELVHKYFDVGFDIFCTHVAWMVIVRVDIFLILFCLYFDIRFLRLVIEAITPLPSLLTNRPISSWTQEVDRWVVTVKIHKFLGVALYAS